MDDLSSISIIPLIPIALVLLLAAFISVEKLLLTVLFLVPLSVQLRFIVPEVAADLFLPTEPMLAAILAVMLYKTVAGEIDRRILRHPVTVLTALLLVWICITSFTGSMPLVSLKYLVTRLWFVAGFYLLATQLFMKKELRRKYFAAYLWGMTPVALYYLIRLSQFGVLNQVSAYSAVRPFFNDHTVFGAALAFCIPTAVFVLTGKERSRFDRIVTFLQLALFSVTFIYSYSRAAWISLAVSGFVVLIIRMRISWKIIVPAAIILALAIGSSWSSVKIKLNENKQNSSLVFRKQIESIANISTDASNLERINRWNSAVRMAKERPVFGWGPGTYQFRYASFQKSEEKTRISTNFGERGNAHSEYLGLLSETGIPGMALYIILLLTILARIVVLYRKEPGSDERIMFLCMAGGIVTYIVHGALNNFLDTDKISVLFWGMAAIIVAADTEAKKTV
jgi:putative inorganic carbon (hco3(-)) transporter